MHRPTVRYGSRGEIVFTLQEALNLWPEPTSQTLAVDGIFGPKTQVEVKRFQSFHKVTSDGIVGPVTWELLEPLLEELLKHIPPPQQAEEARERIVGVAESALATFGWPSGSLQFDNASQRIAAAKCADPTNPLRPRQGGLSLRSIFELAGAQPSYYPRCFTISIEAEQQWQQSGGAATAWRNSHDLPSWCGIFCYYVYRAAGIDLGGWVNHKKNVTIDKRFLVSTSPSSVGRGSIGVIDGIRAGGRNHHFIVTGNQGASIESIDGNTHGPNQHQFATNLSTVARRRYPYSHLSEQQAYFLFPDFKQL